MKSFCFLMSLNYIQFFFQYGNAVLNEYALVAEIDGYRNLDLAWPITSLDGEFSDYIAWRTKLIYLCPTETKPALHIVDEIEGDAQGPEKKLCDEPVEPTIMKVSGKLYDAQMEVIDIYKIGFLVNDDKLRNIQSYTQYESLDRDYQFLPTISFYRNVDLQYTVAADYIISKVDVRKTSEKKDVFTYKHSDLFSDKFEQLYHDQESKLKEILGHTYTEDKHILVLDSLVSENGFLIDTWKKTTYFKVLQIPIWKENIENWRSILEYIRHIGKSRHSTYIITTGVGKPLTITDAQGQKRKMEWGEGKDTVFIPELYWASIRIEENANANEKGKTTGMFIIMHNEPTKEDNNVAKVCEKNFCLENNIWHLSDEYEPLKERLYCCAMNIDVIKTLDVAYLVKKLKPVETSKPITFPLKPQ